MASAEARNSEQRGHPLAIAALGGANLRAGSITSVFGGKKNLCTCLWCWFLAQSPCFSLPSALPVWELGIQKGHYFCITGDCRSRECVFAPSQAPTRKVLYHEKWSWREKKEQAKRGKNTKLKEIEIMLCRIVTAVSVFIGCFFWLHFFSNWGSYGQEGVQNGPALPWWKDRGQSGEGGAGHEPGEEVLDS